MAKSLDENIQALSRTVLDEVHSEAEQALVDAKAKADSIHQRAQAQAAAERSEILEHAAREAERIRSQAVASAQLKARTLQLVHREKLIEEVFDATRKQLASIQHREDYQQIANQLLHEALLHLGAGTARIRADAKTSEYFTSQFLSQVSAELQVNAQAGENLTHELGVIAETVDRHRRYDNTLQTRLARIQNSLRAHIYDILMGKAS